MAVPGTRKRAKELVQKIAKDHGYLGEEKLRTIEPELRREIEEAFLRKDQMIGSSVITLAKNLYTSKARFVFELLQNADDNYYTKAAALGEVPSVSFRVFHRQIIMECNEDGFTDKNLEAICNVGKSSKAGSQGYVGEKGIGFKSVFMAAWKAHIQSGAFSFSFSHRNGESGMGMISPVWEEPQEEQDLLLTRLTLHLHDIGQPGVLENTHTIIREQFHELQETILLFMKNLRSIRVTFYDENETSESSVAYSIERPRPNHAVLVRTEADNGIERRYVKHYHVTTHRATSVPRHENRTHSGHADDTSEVVLAFPLSETSVPILKPQDIFVYLPVRPAGFKFIIHADFVTDASRQDIVKDSLRNIALLDGIADAFARAALQFCEHNSLQLQWMRYLPDKKNENWGPLWMSLVGKIANRLSQIPVLFCHKNHDRHRIGDLVRLSLDCYENGEPLFEDGEPEKIISQRYDNGDLDILGDYGLNYANWGHICAWLATDLNRGTRSRMRSPTTTANWHAQTAKLLHSPFSNNYAVKSQLVDMALLPLKDGTWVSATTDPVYFAKVAGIDIPPNTGLRIIDQTITDPRRKTLFQDLGAKEASVTLIRRKILDMYGESGLLADLSVQISKQHLAFLYLTQHLESWDEPSFPNLVILDEDERPRDPWRYYIYMANDMSSYSPWELLRGSSSLPGCDAPGFMNHYFMHEAYFIDSPMTPKGQKLTWVEWFHSKLRVDKYVHFGQHSLSSAAKYLQEHRPEKFLGALQVHHQHNPDLSPEFIACVQDTEVLCREGQKILLQNTFFPTQRLEGLVERFVGHDRMFPWIWMEDDTTHHSIPERWYKLLRKVEVAIPLNDLEFALHMLRYSVNCLQSDFIPANRNKLFSLYSFIQTQYRSESGSLEARDSIRLVGSSPPKSWQLNSLTRALTERKAFEEDGMICIPYSGSNEWVSPENCVWYVSVVQDDPSLPCYEIDQSNSARMLTSERRGAIHELETKFALRLHYKNLHFLTDEDRQDIEQLFSNTLGICDCTLEIYVDELKEIRQSCKEDSDIIEALYKEIDRLWRLDITHEMSKGWLRAQFEEHALIYVPSDDGASWRKISQCVWSTAARLRDMVSLNDEYENLEDFFVNTLGVKQVTLTMAIDELKEAGKRRPVSVAEVEASLLTVNSLLCSESDPPLAQADLIGYAIFPVRYPEGGVQCVSARTQFFLADRESMRSSFAKHVRFLNFSLEKIVQLQPFIDWVGLHDRYISRCVRKFTSVTTRNAQPIYDPDRQFRYRAHAMLRIAKHYKSPRAITERDTDALYELLRNAKIFATDAITEELRLTQDGVAYTAPGGSMNVHLDEEGPNLIIYVPRKKTHQQDALNRHLPERLIQWLMTEEGSRIPHKPSEKAIMETNHVWNTPLGVLSAMLSDCGIVSIPIPNLDPVIEESPSETESEDSSEEAAGDWSGSQNATQNDERDLGSRSELIGTSPLAPDTPRDNIGDAHLASSPVESSASLAAQGGESILPVRSSDSIRDATQVEPCLTHDDTLYLSVLESIIAWAATSTIPGRYEEGMHDLQRNVLNLRRGASRIVGDTQFERDCKIGAAGELFVFELLSHLSPALPNFSRANWQSTIRRYVKLHPSYERMSPWTGRETSDITYEDTHGVLTDFLIRNQYLDSERWAGKSPQYFIEVKTTTSACDTPFFMSNSQYERMKSTTLTEVDTNMVYVVFRVYQLDQGDQGPGLRIYVDPEALRLSGELNFTAPTWSVVPG